MICEIMDWKSKVYFDMNESILYCIMFSLYSYVSWFWLETSSPLLNLFKVTHLYYKMNFRYQDLFWILRHVNFHLLLFCLENMLIFFEKLIFFWPDVGIVHGLPFIGPKWGIDCTLMLWRHVVIIYYILLTFLDMMCMLTCSDRVLFRAWHKSSFTSYSPILTIL